jgi:hypothetical protein
MFFEGAPRLALSDASVVPVRKNSSNNVVVEAYPALVARALVGVGSYKSVENAGAQEVAFRLRQKMVDRLTSGIQVTLPEQVATACINDPDGDSIDAIFAAIQTAWAWRRRDVDFGIPDNCDLCEGWIVDPLTQPSLNSSITRVRPVLQRLFQSDPTGASWLPNLLGLSPGDFSDRVKSAPGLLVQSNLKTRTYTDRLVGEIELESCFEYSAPPSDRFPEMAPDESA